MALLSKGCFTVKVSLKVWKSGSSSLVHYSAVPDVGFSLLMEINKVVDKLHP